MVTEIKGRLTHAIIAGAMLVLLAIFKWSIIDRISPFLFMPFDGVIWLYFIIVVIASLTCILKYKKIGLVSLAPLGILAFAFMAVNFVPFTKLWIKADFAFYKNEREEVVQQVYKNELKPNVSYNPSLINLDDSYPSLSAGGNDIIVEEHDDQKYVFFFTFRGVLDNYSGFVYVPEGGDPRNFSDLNEISSTQITPLGGNWYFGSHH